MFAIDDEVAASCYSLNRQLSTLANQSLLSRAVLPPRVRRLTEQETCVMADLIETLALSADKVKRGATYTTRRRFGGGHFNIFDPPAAVRSLLRRNGGLLGFQERIAARRKRAANKEKKEKEDESRRADRQSQLEKGMAVLELPLDYWYGTPNVGCKGSICWLPRGANPSFGNQLHFLAHSYYLDNYAGEKYAEDVENTIEEKRGRFYPEQCAPEDLDDLDEYAEWEVLF